MASPDAPQVKSSVGRGRSDGARLNLQMTITDQLPREERGAKMAFANDLGQFTIAVTAEYRLNTAGGAAARMRRGQNETGREGPVSSFCQLLELNNAEFTRKDSVDADIASVRQILDPRKFFGYATPLLHDAGEDAR
jgi:hypothetical protein